MIQRPSSPTFLFAPGAGAGSSHPWMQRWAELLRSLGTVHLMDYPYMKSGQKRPDPLPKLIAAHAEALREIRASRDGPVILIGKSMGSKVGCHVSLKESVGALICLGYPLCGGGDPTKLRDKVLRDLTTPILFVQGTRDRLCPLELLQPIRAEINATNGLHVVEEGDHSLMVTKKWLKEHGQTQNDVDQRILTAINDFLASQLR
jgi:predicted alpha/beta-hydrolase family hydrolase